MKSLRFGDLVSGESEFREVDPNQYVRCEVWIENGMFKSRLGSHVRVEAPDGKTYLVSDPHPDRELEDLLGDLPTPSRRDLARVEQRAKKRLNKRFGWNLE